VYRACFENNVPLWIGGMLETGIGRAANLAFASLPGVTFPSDISATDRYFLTDITEPPFKLRPDSTIAVPNGVGIGVDVQLNRVDIAAQMWEQEYPYRERAKS
jgi:O-succinylbenzoate synthase